MLNITWLRSDLRVYDNPALSASMAAGNSVAVYCLCEQQWDEHRLSIAKRDLIKGALLELEKQLSHLNVPLIIVDAGHFSAIPNELLSLCQRFNTQHVFFNAEYEFNEKQCASNTRRLLNDHAIEARMYHDQCLIKPGDIRTEQGQCYKVFSAFRRTFYRDAETLIRPLVNKPKPQGQIDVHSDLTALNINRPADETQCGLIISEEAAHQQLNDFIEQRIHAYDEHRDFPALEGTSRLSAYIATGMISTRQCLQGALSINQGMMEDGNAGIVTWISELIWRDFYRHLIDAYPKLSKGFPFLSTTDNLPWRGDSLVFQQWCDGKTGFPIVDAAMRQLNETGWMHNRLRMVVAMVLTKHLFVDWRLGERYFMEHLIDADFASNNGGWQWSASTGVDAVPYFRIFNPYRQSKRFDPKGEFIRKYVKELENLSDKDIHQPPAKVLDLLKYPRPVVDIQSAGNETKRLFKQLKSPADILR